MINKKQLVHFIGIGGIGISALAYLKHSEGWQVTGSDENLSSITKQLETEGIQIYDQHNGDHVHSEIDLVIYTAAIDPSKNAEFQKAKILNIPTMSYFEALGKLSETKKTLAVIGTHGKTTTTAMLGVGLLKANVDATIIVGSKVAEFNHRNIHIGEGDWLIVEACEYKKSFLNLKPFGVIFLNCEAEHLDFYKTEENYINAYSEFIQKIPKEGFLVANMEDERVKKIIKGAKCQIIEISENELENEKLSLKVPGKFNQLNALHALKAGELIGATTKDLKKGLSEFQGTWRRMETKGIVNGSLIIDDYAHHPTEIKETLKAIKEKHPKKELVCVFQPHQYSRTFLLANEFKAAFISAEKVFITDIYEARDSDEDKKNINAQILVDLIRANHQNVEWSGNLNQTEKKIKSILKENQVVVIMGAGNIGQLAEKLTLKPSSTTG